MRSDAASEARRTLALVPNWKGTAGELRALAPPSEQEFERLDAGRQHATALVGAARAEVTRLNGEKRESQAALDLLQERPLPDTAAVLAARAQRDRGATDKIEQPLFARRLAFPTVALPAGHRVDTAIASRGLPVWG